MTKRVQQLILSLALVFILICSGLFILPHSVVFAAPETIQATLEPLSNRNGFTVSRNGTAITLGFSNIPQQNRSTYTSSEYTHTYHAIPLGAEIVTTINSQSLPLVLDFDLELPANLSVDTISPDDTGGIGDCLFLYNQNGLTTGSISVYVEDSLGNPVQGTLQVLDEELTLSIPTYDGLAYPLYSTLTIVPGYTFTDFFYTTSRFREREGKISLTLDVNKLADGWFLEQYVPGSVADTSWAQVVDKFSSDSNWYNEQGLYEQYRCHLVFAWPVKTEWNIEPWRPCVGYTATVDAECNP